MSLQSGLMPAEPLTSRKEFMTILNQLDISDSLCTSGQPRADQFAFIAERGFEAVINLAMATSDGALPQEGDLVTGLGLTYLHIPVPWNAPSALHFQLFAAALQALQPRKVWVHCALNMRVSAFVYRYRTQLLGCSEAVAREALHKIWTPNATWTAFLQPSTI